VSDPTPRDKNGHWMEKPESAMPYAFTSQNAAAMARRRWEKYREAAADAVTKQLGKAVPDITTPEQAWGVMNARLAVQIMKSDKPRGDHLTDLGRNMGAIPNAYERTEIENSPPAAAATALGTELARQFMQIVNDVLNAQRDPARPADAIDATATDIRNEPSD
jgi:hypothetical protein